MQETGARDVASSTSAIASLELVMVTAETMSAPASAKASTCGV
jgi:hypothetical protein